MRKHHSHAHGDSLLDKEYECAYCGDNIVRKPANVGENPFCSRDCYGSWMSENKTGEDSPRWNGGKQTLECDFCGDPVSRKPSVAEKQNNTFCSEVCWGNWLSENRVGEDHPEYSKVDVECEWCGEIYETLRPERTRFCSASCNNEWLSSISGKDHPAWNGGESSRIKYGPGWNEKKRQTVRQRDNFKCQVCGMTEEEHIEDCGRSLNVHHQTPAREFDDPHVRNHPDNLITLCASCHVKVEHESGTY